MSQPSIIDSLVEIFYLVRNYILHPETKKGVIDVNPRGGLTREFDLVAEKMVIDYLMTHYPNSKILSEESGFINHHLNDFDYLFVIDPVDGSFNLVRGIPLVGFSIAVFKSDDISTKTVTHAIIGNIYSGLYLTAVAGEGAYMREQLITSYLDNPLEEKIVSCSLNRFEADQFILFQALNQTFKNIRSFSCSSIELSYVIQGITSAHYDFRKRLTAENFLAAALILEEMGGKLSDLNGNAISGISDLIKGYSIIACHRADDLHQYLDVLQREV